MKNRFFVIKSTVVAALGGLLFGFDTAVISGTTGDLETVFNLNDIWLGQTVAVALYGTIIGSILVAKPGDIFGRKKVLIVLALFYAVSALGSALADNWYFFLFYRFLGGLAVGGSSVLAPMYIAEISPAHLRGRLVAVQQFNVVFGIMLAFISNYAIASIISNEAWRWMFGIETVPAVLFFVLLFYIPYSPRWLVKKNRSSEAKDVLIKMGETNVDKELGEIEESLRSESEEGKEPLFTKKYRFPIVLGVLIAVFNQLSGINAIMYYAPRIFEMTGIGNNTALLQAVAIGVTNMVFTILAMMMIDKFGRRRLMLIGSVGVTVFLALVARSFYLQDFDGYSVMIYLIGYIAFFAMSQGAVIWVFISEIFPNKVRATGQSLGSFTHWFLAAVITLSFPVIAQRFGGVYAFSFYAMMMVLQFLFVWKIMPETKGKSLEEIQKEFDIS